MLRNSERDEAANKLVEASKCYKKTNPEGERVAVDVTVSQLTHANESTITPLDALKMLVQAVDMLKESGRFHPAAGYQKQIAEVYETDLVDLEKAMNAYEAAYVGVNMV